MTFFWYDYETWGKNPMHDRVVQFGGLRTDENLEQIGDTIELKCQPGLDCPIGPGAIRVHGIMPMEAQNTGLPEGEFASRIHKELRKKGTCSVAYNGMSFDHEFTRVLFYRNLYDPYEWAWKDGNTYWDTVEVMRAAFLLRPDALKNWPKKENGTPSFKLGDLSEANLASEELHPSHDAVTDSIHMWKVAKIIRERAPEFWEYALELRHKKNTQKLMDRGEPVLHVVGGIPTKRYCSTLLSNLGVYGRNSNEYFAFDLFHDPTPFLKPFQQWTPEDKLAARRAIVSFKTNRSPFLCRWKWVGNLTELSLKQLLNKMNLNESEVQGRHDRIQEFLAQDSATPFSEYIQQRESESEYRYSSYQTDPDEAIYDGFITDQDRNLMNQVLREGANFDWRSIKSQDSRVEPLIFRYIARNYPESMDDAGTNRWKAYCRKRQLESKQSRRVTADQIFSYELRDFSESWGNLDESRVKQLLKWQDRVREVLSTPPS